MWEKGGNHLYRFCNNESLNWIDALGLSESQNKPQKPCCPKTAIDNAGHAASQAAVEATKTDDPHNREYCGLLCCDKKGNVRFTTPHSGIFWKTIANRDPSCDPHERVEYFDKYGNKMAIPYRMPVRCKPEEDEVGAYHSHPNKTDFSSGDRCWTKWFGKPFFKGTPDGMVCRLDPEPNYIDDGKTTPGITVPPPSITE